MVGKCAAGRCGERVPYWGAVDVVDGGGRGLRRGRRGQGVVRSSYLLQEVCEVLEKLLLGYRVYVHGSVRPLFLRTGRGRGRGRWLDQRRPRALRHLELVRGFRDLRLLGRARRAGEPVVGRGGVMVEWRVGGRGGADGRAAEGRVPGRRRSVLVVEGGRGGEREHDGHYFWRTRELGKRSNQHTRGKLRTHDDQNYLLPCSRDPFLASTNAFSFTSSSSSSISRSSSGEAQHSLKTSPSARHPGSWWHCIPQNSQNPFAYLRLHRIEHATAVAPRHILASSRPRFSPSHSQAASGLFPRVQASIVLWVGMYASLIALGTLLCKH